MGKLKTFIRVSKQIKTIFMKRKIILTITSAFIFAAGVFAGIKRSTPAKVYFKTTGGTCNQLIGANVPANFTNTAGTFQASIRTIGGTNLLLWSSATCVSNKAYFRN